MKFYSLGQMAELDDSKKETYRLSHWHWQMAMASVFSLLFSSFSLTPKSPCFPRKLNRFVSRDHWNENIVPTLFQHFSHYNWSFLAKPFSRHTSSCWKQGAPCCSHQLRWSMRATVECTAWRLLGKQMKLTGCKMSIPTVYVQKKGKKEVSRAKITKNTKSPKKQKEVNQKPLKKTSTGGLNSKNQLANFVLPHGAFARLADLQQVLVAVATWGGPSEMRRCSFWKFFKVLFFSVFQWFWWSYDSFLTVWWFSKVFWQLYDGVQRFYDGFVVVSSGSVTLAACPLLPRFVLFANFFWVARWRSMCIVHAE